MSKLIDGLLLIVFTVLIVMCLKDVWYNTPIKNEQEYYESMVKELELRLKDWLAKPIFIK